MSGSKIMVEGKTVAESDGVSTAVVPTEKNARGLTVHCSSCHKLVAEVHETSRIKDLVVDVVCTCGTNVYSNVEGGTK